ncbi:TetR family transcriptional regulator [Hyphomonas polymorpha PS728]|uniref:TetR family transcriptional regulator n=1 Tax=Hyphomonas polymorpha PS728 TaxID=1280954 RepID=A0A062VCU6_9PROT|nr:TetR/AcrR family transcriptional regulator [Hyphomonas polymorpha]KCZ98108.1 TetR family transcriptional regulator [Hyphomonas polymorpha PS728]
MARPKPDETSIREQLLSTAESLLSYYGAGKVTVTDIAAACGMSQSNAYRYFPSKASLMAALGKRWFAEVEAMTDEIIARYAPPREKLREIILATFQIKRARLEADPGLFAAYMELAAANAWTVSTYTEERNRKITALVAAHLASTGQPASQAAQRAQTVLDATVLIRDPNLIQHYRAELTDERAERLAAFALTLLDIGRAS